MGARPINKFTVNVDTRYSRSERNQLGLSIIDFIVNRTKNGLGIGGKAFKSRYSKDYVRTPDFEIAGKSATDVNLTLSGDMLDSIEILNINNIGSITIGFTSDTESDKSVFLEEKGFKFLGLTENELSKVVSEFGPPGQDIQPGNISPSLTQSLIRGIFGS